MSSKQKGGLLGSLLTGNISEPSLQMQTESFAANATSTNRRLPDRVKEINPTKCRLWKFADRPEDEAQHATEIASSMDDIEQISPVIAREISIDDPDYPNIEFEIIAGSVRWRAAKLRNKPLKAIVKALSDREAISIMIAENEHRRGITPFARSLQLQTVWESGMFESQDELALAHHMDKAKASMHLKVAANADFLRQVYGNDIGGVGLRQLYDACKFEREGECGESKKTPKSKEFTGYLVKTNKSGITTIKFAKQLSEDQLSKIREIVESET